MGLKYFGENLVDTKLFKKWNKTELGKRGEKHLARFESYVNPAWPGVVDIVSAQEHLPSAVLRILAAQRGTE